MLRTAECRLLVVHLMHILRVYHQQRSYRLRLLEWEEEEEEEEEERERDQVGDLLRMIFQVLFILRVSQLSRSRRGRGRGRDVGV
jgi:hypothetical protein